MSSNINKSIIIVVYDKSKYSAPTKAATTFPGEYIASRTRTPTPLIGASTLNCQLLLNRRCSFCVLSGAVGKLINFTVILPVLFSVLIGGFTVAIFVSKVSTHGSWTFTVMFTFLYRNQKVLLIASEIQNPSKLHFLSVG